MKTKASLVALALAGVSANVFAADNLVISEYVEGSSNNKAIELYNPTAAAVDLSQYQLKFYFNGNTTAGSNIALSGILAPGATFVVADNDASADILSRTQLASNASFFNGDDAIVLEHLGSVIDSLGQIGVDPGSQWGSGLLSTADNTLRRDAANLIADTDPFDAVTLSTWIGFEQDDFSNLGQFSSGPTDPTDPTDPPAEGLVCGTSATAIHSIQGADAASPLVGQIVEVEALVVSNQEAGLKGVFLQMADAEQDSDAQTSEGVFLYTGNAPTGYQVGDRVRVKAKVVEYQGLTELTNLTDKTLCATAQPLPTAAALSLPVTDVTELEAFEGMLVNFSQNLVVNEVYNLGRYGEIMLGGSRHFIGTQVAAPGADAVAVTAANQRDSILLDDGRTSQNPDPVIYPAPGLSATNTVRVGDTVTNLTAVMHYGFGVYRLMPVDTVNFVASNPRADAPALDAGNLKVASFNVLNYFNGDGLGGGFPTARGANTAVEFERQRAKIISAMKAIDADVLGLMEIENDGFGSESAIADLVNGLNAATEAGRYSYINPGVAAIGTDAISVGIIYRADRVTPEGAAAILDSSNSAVDEEGKVLFNDQKNRPMLAQAFRHLETDESVVVAVNHFKSKGSDCVAENDPDLGDGQGNCNLTRTRAAKAVGEFLNTEFADAPVLVIGDLNSYAMENPLTALNEAGLTELFAHLGKEAAYSYVFSGESGQLDHALASAALLDKVVDVTEWHINTDEPRILDYNVEFKSAGQVESLYSMDAYRSSDHDPVVISLQLERANELPVANFSYEVRGRKAAFVANATDADGDIVAIHWNFGDGTEAMGDAVEHKFAKRGVYQVSLTVTDNLGGSTTVTQQVGVGVNADNQAPVAAIEHLDFGLFHVFVSASYDTDGRIRKQLWQFNDGVRFASSVVLRRAGRATEVNLTVTDNDGATDSTSLSF
ncbi:ExeM/NucH family extracellular endonuclease [Shewanella zhangzhouensis]|uniref:ExeM/NucH family extracellular endonuclease n=1 Tax=Shewanella zhangzhouensis TaxID=2864213 RepID=UPI001C6567F4|nr:ExeM/NucH family extracellular endonuclease [Shewanella zhangzhouensis]QYK06725.1 ExeM/NucH family extracellular endonuclease [Shewanella zhangzhouensis]